MKKSDVLGALAELDLRVAEGTISDPYSGTVTEDIGDAGRCTDTAQWLRRRLGGVVMGYPHDNNPKAVIGKTEGGHDFLLVDNWIVDWWARDYMGLPAFYNLSNKSDAVEALKNYGPESKWVPVPDWGADWYKKSR